MSTTLSMRWREAAAPELVPTHLALGYPVSVLSPAATEGAGYGVRGRSVVVAAGSAVAAGEVALVAQPYAVAVDQPFLRKVCLGCTAVSDKQLALACECGYAAYCSPACRDGLGGERHRPVCGYEGAVLDALHELDESGGDPLRPQPCEETTVRLLLATLLTYEEGESEAAPARTRVRGCPTFADVLAQASCAETPRRAALARLVHAAFADVLPEEKQPSAEVVAGLLARDQCNSFGFWTPKAARFATAFAPATALLNHSCAPTCVKVTGPGFTVTARAMRPLRGGDELTYSYIPLAAPAAERRLVLESVFQFTCDCERCVSAEEGEVETTPLEAHECGGVIYPLPRLAGRRPNPPLLCSACGMGFKEYPGLKAEKMGCCGPAQRPKGEAAAEPARQAAPEGAMFDMADSEYEEGEEEEEEQEHPGAGR